MSATRAERTARQLERVSAVFDDHPGLVTKSILALMTGVPETSIVGLMVQLRKEARDREHVPVVLKAPSGEWLYGWAGPYEQHVQEHVKRRRNEARSLRLSIETLAQSVAEHPDSTDFRNQLLSARHRLEDVELQIEAATGQLRLVREQVDAVA